MPANVLLFSPIRRRPKNVENYYSTPLQIKIYYVKFDLKFRFIQARGGAIAPFQRYGCSLICVNILSVTDEHKDKLRCC